MDTGTNRNFTVIGCPYGNVELYRSSLNKEVKCTASFTCTPVESFKRGSTVKQSDNNGYSNTTNSEIFD